MEPSRKPDGKQPFCQNTISLFGNSNHSPIRPNPIQKPMDAQMRLPTQKTKNLRKISERGDSEQNCGTNSSSIDPHLEAYANSDSFSSDEGYLLWLKDNDPDEYEE